MISTLFSDKRREDRSPGKYSEDTFSFIDRSARPNAVEVRRILEIWFKDYPAVERAALKDRLQNDFYAGFLELFLHSYFYANSFTLDPHPAVPNSTRKPDFLVRHGECEFYLEATIVRDKSDQAVAGERVENILLDAINSVESPNFFLDLRDFTIAPGKQPAAKRIKAFLKQELPKYNPDEVEKALVENPGSGGPILQFQDDTLFATIGLIPLSRETRGAPGIRPIGIHPPKTRFGGGDSALRESINDKAKRYGAPDRPYVICANYIGEWGVDPEDILNALFGTFQLTATTDRPHPVPSRKPDGIFRGRGGPWNTRVSGVIVANLFPWNIPSARFELYHNPWATLSLKSHTLPLRQASVEGSRLEWRDGVSLSGLYRLPAGWPG
jgi:hypothetical protein